MMARANRQQLRTIKLPAKRGEIVDRAGNRSRTRNADTIAADPSDIDNRTTWRARLRGAR